MESKAHFLSYSPYENQHLLMLLLDDDIGNELGELQTKDLTISIKQYKPKRSNNANAYCWSLCTQIASKIGGKASKDDVYRLAIKDVGLYQDFRNQSLQNEKTLSVAWSALGTGWFTERVDFEQDGETVCVRCYYGSSSYDSKAMSRLIDWLVEEAETQGINVMSAKDRALLLDDWDNERKKYG